MTTEAGIVKIDEKAIGVETKRIVSYLPERPCFSSSFRIRDIINSYESFYEDFDRKVAHQMLQSLQIDEKSKISSLSKGTGRRYSLLWL